MLDSLTLYIVILTEDPVNPSLDPVTRWYGWRYLSLYRYCCYSANIFQGRIEYELIYSLRGAKHKGG